MTTKQPPTFDWVTARHNCSAMTMLERLRQQVKTDTRRYNELNRTERFVFDQSEDRDVYRFTVLDRQGRARRGVQFDWDGEAIQIAASGIELRPMKVTFTVTDDGECKFRIGDDVLDQWQVSRRALESLFFDPLGL